MPDSPTPTKAFRCASLLAVSLAVMSSAPVTAQRLRPTGGSTLSSSKRGVGGREGRHGAARWWTSSSAIGELGFQEVETSRYLVGLLRREGFTVDTGVAGIPTAWVARWGRGRPVDRARLRHRRHSAGVPGARGRLPDAAGRRRARTRRGSQLGAGGEYLGRAGGEADHGAREAARDDRALARGRRGTARRQAVLGTRRRLQRRGRGAVQPRRNRVRDLVGRTSGSGLVSVLYQFSGNAAHAGGRPWRGRSALDAVELMDIGWNFRREHLPLKQRSHSVIVDGGDQPNVVPQTASVWYYSARDRLQGDPGALGRRRLGGAGRGADDRHDAAAVPRARRRLAPPLQPPHGRGDGRPTSSASACPRGPATTSSSPARSSGRWGSPTRAQADRGFAATADGSGAEHGRSVGRHRRRLLDGAHGRALLSRQREWAAGPSLVERDGDGNADRAQGRRSRGPRPRR